MPEAVVNFIAFLGWSPDPSGKRQLFTIDEMIHEVRVYSFAYNIY